MASTLAALPLAALAFAAWCVYLGGLAAMQSSVCIPGGVGNLDGVVLGSPVNTSLLNCSKIYRYFWFIFAYEFVIVVGLAIAAVTGLLASTKQAFIGLFAVATMLYIETSNRFLTDFYSHIFTGSALNRIRTLIAGAIMTATFNALIICVVGNGEAVPAREKAVVEKAGTTATAV